MPCMVIVIGCGKCRSPYLDQAQVDAKTQFGQLQGGCPNCTGGGFLSFDAGTPKEAVLSPPGTTQMYVLTFSGSDPGAAEANAREWMKAESDWLDRAGMNTYTFRY